MVDAVGDAEQSGGVGVESESAHSAGGSADVAGEFIERFADSEDQFEIHLLVTVHVGFGFVSQRLCAECPPVRCGVSVLPAMPSATAVRALPEQHPVVRTLDFDTDFASEVGDFSVGETEAADSGCFAGAVGLVGEIFLGDGFALEADSAVWAVFVVGAPAVFFGAFLIHRLPRFGLVDHPRCTSHGWFQDRRELRTSSTSNRSVFRQVVDTKAKSNVAVNLFREHQVPQ